ncbi:hypothetical protein K2173_021681 [Erythroxylum novogranatense]|uniref:Exostosin GT47 domain-containing protein n=1 Tax=Erythroxylum novogranatense TaxID=1862640 RepID=A0AAV8TJ18_9ROSI|nr:hypothetical protein K2173_021681 [Erythroxylum novogranatense]
MAIYVSKRKSRPSKKTQPKEVCFCFTFLLKVLLRIPAVIFLSVLIFLWASSSIITSANGVHVCISSRKLNNLYCLSAGTRPNFEVPIAVPNNSSTSPDTKITNTKEIDVSSSDGVGSVKDNTDVSPDNTVNDNIKGIEKVVRENPQYIVMDEIIKGKYDEEIAIANKVVEDQMRLHRSWKSNRSLTACEGRGLYVYDLPSKFNKDLIGQCGDMIPWADFCKYFTNEGLGEPLSTEFGKGWYNTHQYLLEPIFHAKILKHPCRVYNENEAKLFYVPYYGGLDILRWHFQNVSNDVKDILALELIKWLEPRKTWIQNSGKDHVFVLGKVSWDFRRRIDSPWGTRLLHLEQMQNPIKLLLERQPWEVNEIGIPHPTFFHPDSDDDIVSWQLKVIRAARNSLVSFAGAARPYQPESIRTILIDQCTSASDKCQFLNCSSGGCGRPEKVLELFVGSEFCLQPPGDSPTRKSVFDSLISGCIPVLFDPFTAYYQYPWHLPEDHGRYSIHIDQEEVRHRKVNVTERLMNVSVKERDDMRRYIVFELLPGLVYGDLNSQLEKFKDAFSITVNNLLERVNILRM